MEYIAKIKHAEGRWLVEFPDCPGCQTFGATEREARELAQEALEGWLETGLLHGDVPPRPAFRKGWAVRVRPRLDVAIQIRWLRDTLGLTQAQLATRAGVSQQQIAKLENPDANPTIGTLDALTRSASAALTITITITPPPADRDRTTPYARELRSAARSAGGMARESARGATKPATHRRPVRKRPAKGGTARTPSR